MSAKNAICGALAMCLAATACATTNQGVRTAGLRNEDLSSVEAGMRRQFDELEGRLQRSGMRNTDPVLNAYLRDLSCAIAGDFCTEIRVYVLNTPEFNASMASNGMMLVNSGLLLRVENEAQLAFVMAHEFGHYYENHVLERVAAMRNASGAGQILSWGLLFVGAGALSTLGYAAAAASAMDFTRDQEREADLYAIQFVQRQGYDAMQGVAAWENLRAEIAASSNERTRNTARERSIFSTHPPTDERIAYLRAAAAQSPGGGGVDRSAYRAIIRPNLLIWLRAELADRDAGATLALIDRLASLNEDMGVLEFARAEVYLHRGGDGDAERALARYDAASQHSDAPVETWRQIGVLKRRLNDNIGAADAFDHYLEVAPSAPDRMLIEDIAARLRGESP